MYTKELTSCPLCHAGKTSHQPDVGELATTTTFTCGLITLTLHRPNHVKNTIIHTDCQLTNLYR